MWRIEQIEKEPSSRCAHQADFIDDYMYIFGGWNDENQMLNDTHRFNSVTWEWESLKTLSKDSILVTPRNGHTMTTYKNELIVFGGGSFSGFLNDVLIFSPVLMKWSIIKECNNSNDGGPCGRSKHSSCLLDDKLYIFGGGDGIRLYNDMYYLDLLNWKWHKIDTAPNQTLPSQRWGHSMVKLNDNKSLLLFGGHSGSKRLNDMYIFNTQDNKWTLMEYQKDSIIPPPRAGHTATIIGNHMILFGGGDGKIINDSYLLDTIEWKWWKFNHTPPEGRCAHSAILIKNKLIIYGGGNGLQCLRKLIILDSIDQLDNIYNQFKLNSGVIQDIKNQLSPIINTTTPTITTPSSPNTIKKLKSQTLDLNLSLSQLSSTIELKVQKILKDKEQQQKSTTSTTTTTPILSSLSNSNSRLNEYEKRDIIEFLNRIGMSKFIDKFIEEEIDITIVHLLNENHLKELGINSLGDRLSIIKGIRERSYQQHQHQQQQQQQQQQTTISFEYEPRFIED